MNFSPNTPNVRCTSRFSEDILNIIKKVYSSKRKIFINNEVDEDYKKEKLINKSIEKKYKYYKKVKQIGIETMKFFHRQQRFKHLYCIFGEQDKNKVFKEIKDTNESILLLINENDKFKFFKDKKDDPLKEYKKVKYLIINGKKEKKNYFDNFESIFTYDIDGYEESIENSLIDLNDK